MGFQKVESGTKIWGSNISDSGLQEINYLRQLVASGRRPSTVEVVLAKNPGTDAFEKLASSLTMEAAIYPKRIPWAKEKVLDYFKKEKPV